MGDKPEAATAMPIMVVPYSNLKLIMQKISILERVRMQKTCKALMNVADTNMKDKIIWAQNMVVVIDTRDKGGVPNSASITTYLHKEKKMEKTFPLAELLEQIQNYKNFYFQKIAIVAKNRDAIQDRILIKAILKAKWSAHCLNYHYRVPFGDVTAFPSIPGIKGIELIFYNDVDYTEEHVAGRIALYFGERLMIMQTSVPSLAMTPPLGLGAETLALHGIEALRVEGWEQLHYSGKSGETSYAVSEDAASKNYVA